MNFRFWTVMLKLCATIVFLSFLECGLKYSTEPTENLEVLKAYIKEVSLSDFQTEDLVKKYYFNADKILSNEKYLSLIEDFNQKIKKSNNNTSLKVKYLSELSKEYTRYTFSKNDIDNIFIIVSNDVIDDEKLKPILMIDGKIKSFKFVKKGDKVQWW